MKKLYVGNLPFSVSEASLVELFSSFGSIDKATLITDRATGSSKGFGFVEMSNDAEANEAIGGLNGKEVDGRRLNVSEDRPQEERGPQQSRNNSYSRPFRRDRR